VPHRDVTDGVSASGPLRRAHQQLLESDATAEAVAAVAKWWGFTNPGRFAAAYVTPIWGITGQGTAPVDPRHRRA
jgi:hypothetical protein